MKTVYDAKILGLPKIEDPRGNLSIIEQMKQIPFEIKRTYWIYDVTGGKDRGGHAYKENEEFITEATELYGCRGKQQADQLVQQIGGLFAGGELSDDEMDAMLSEDKKSKLMDSLIDAANQKTTRFSSVRRKKESDDKSETKNRLSSSSDEFGKDLVSLEELNLSDKKISLLSDGDWDSLYPPWSAERCRE